MALAVICAIISAFLAAITIHIDKYLISKLVKNFNYRGLIIFSSLVSGLIMLPIYAIITGLQVAFDPLGLLLVWAGATSLLISVIFYYKALAKEEASSIVVMFLLSPVFIYFFGALFLGETLTTLQIIGGAIVTLSSTAVTYEFDKGKFSKKKLTALLWMLLASLLTALYYVLFRVVTESHDFNASVFWSNAAMTINGILLFIILKRYRRAFINLVHQNGVKAFTLNIINEVLFSFATVLLQYSALFAPVIIANLVGSAVQPIFVIVIAILLTTFAPKISRESMKKTKILQKLACIIAGSIGLIFLLS